MSQNNSVATKESPANVLDRMINEGRSFSGGERNVMFLNTGERSERRFATISAVSGLDFPDDGRAIALVDWDFDGDLDAWVTNRNAPRIRFMKNQTRKSGQSIQFRLVGNGVDVNRDAIGARVVVELAPKSEGQDAVRLVKTLRAGEGFLAQSDTWLHFGLGSDATITKVTVTWPNRKSTVEQFELTGSNGRWELKQGTGKAFAVDSRRVQLKLSPSTLTVPAPSKTHRIPLVYQVPAPTLGYFDFNDKPKDFDLDSRHATLINIWSSTCRPCLAELNEFSERYKELEAAGIQVLALSIDGFDTENPDVKTMAAEMAKSMPFDAGLAPASIMEDLRNLHNLLIKAQKPLPLPTSFLIDRNGNIDILYKGPVSVDTLLVDAKPVELDLYARYERAAAFPGTYINHKSLNAPIDTDASLIHLKIAETYSNRGQVKKAIAEYRKVLAIVPDSASGHNYLGAHLKMDGKIDEAIKSFRESVRLRPDEDRVRINLAEALRLNGNTSEAMQQVNVVLQRTPDYADAHFTKGVLEVLARKFKQSQGSLQKAIESNPRHVRAHFMLAKNYETQRSWNQAKYHYEKVIEFKPDEILSVVNLSTICMRENNFEKAESLVRDCIKRNPKNSDAHYQLGVVLNVQGKTTQARKAFETALQFNSRHGPSIQALQKLAGR